MPSSIRIGSRVSALIGPLQPLSEAQLQMDKRPKRKRERLFGTVFLSAPEHRLVVFWDRISRCSDHSTAQLCDQKERVCQEDVLRLVNKLQKDPSLHLKSQKDIDLFYEKMRGTTSTFVTPSPVPVQVQTDSSVEMPIDQTEERFAPQPSNSQEQMRATDHINGPTNERPQDQSNISTREEPEDIFEDEDVESRDRAFPDPHEIAEDLHQDDCTGRTLQREEMYNNEKPRLIGEQVAVGPANSKLTWTVREDIMMEECPGPTQYKKIGVKNFDFQQFTVTCPDGKNKRINFLELLIHLWPGNWRKQLQLLNERIVRDNVEKSNTKRHGRYRQMELISEREFWIWWGIIIVARLEGRKGNVWDKNEPEGYGKKVDMRKYMVQDRHRAIRNWMAYLWADASQEGTDEWWPVRQGITLYNKNREYNFLAGVYKVLDESMSAFRPQKAKTGNLPHLTYCERKPEDLGTEFKVVACPEIGCCLYLEIQEGRDAMRRAEHTNELSVTKACTVRLCENTQREEESVDENEVDIFRQNDDNKPVDTYLGDSWFGHVDTCLYIKKKLKRNFIGVIKTGHSRFPRKYLEKNERLAWWIASSTGDNT